MKKVSFLLALLCASVMSFALDEVLFEQTYPGEPSAKTAAYTKKFTLAMGGYTLEYANINNGNSKDNWDILRAGRNNGNASVATITSEQIDMPVSRVVINFTQVDASLTNSLSLKVASNATFTQDVQTISATIAVGAVEFVVPEPVEDLYYQIVIDMKAGSSNGFNRFNKVTFYTPLDESVQVLRAEDVDFGTILVKQGETMEPIVKELVVIGQNLEEAIVVSECPTTIDIDGELTTEGGTLTLTINALGGDFLESFMLTSGEMTIEVTVRGNVVEVREFDVAEVASTALSDNDFIGVRGVVTGIAMNPKNFVKYGSVNIYVVDVNGGEDEFEFYNCYSFNADTFKVTTPAYDPAGTDYVSFGAVADGNGIEVEVGDTVVAWGKYYYYSEGGKHELNTGCYLVSIKKPGSDTPLVPTALDAMAGERKAVKRLVRGQLVIEYNGLRFNVLGAPIR